MKKKCKKLKFNIIKLIFILLIIFMFNLIIININIYAESYTENLEDELIDEYETWVTNSRDRISIKEKYDIYKTNRKKIVTITVEGSSWIQGTASQGTINAERFLGLWKNDTGKYVEGALYNKDGKIVSYKMPKDNVYKSPDKYITSSPEIFFNLLTTTERTAKYEKPMRYILWKYTGKSYGITDENLDEILNIFDENKLKEVNSDNIGVEFTNSWENDSARDYINGKISYTDNVPNVITEDKKYYICYTDLNHTRNFGYGVCHYGGGEEGGEADRLIDTYFNMASINIKEQQYNEVGVSKMPVEIADAIGLELWNSYYQETQDRRLQYAPNSPELTKNQIIALTDMRYQGCIIWPDFYEIYETQNEAAIKDYILSHSMSPPERGEARWLAYSQGIYKTKSREILKLIDNSGKEEAKKMELEVQEKKGIKEMELEIQEKEGTKKMKPKIQEKESGGVGTETNSNDPYNQGYTGWYTNSKGKKFTLYRTNLGPWKETELLNWGCGTASVCIILSAYGSHETPLTLLNAGKAYTHDQNLTNENIIFENIAGTDKEKIRANLKEGNPVIIFVKPKSTCLQNTMYEQHFVTLLDIDNNNKVYLANPYYIDNGNGGSKDHGWFDIDYALTNVTRFYLIKGKQE